MLEIEGIENVTPATVEKETITKRLENIFDDLLSKNFVTKEVKIGNTIFVLKTLSTGEFLESESVYVATLANIPADVINRVRLISNLAFSIVSINGVPVETDDKREEMKLRDDIHSMLLRLPPPMIDILAESFMDLVKEQNNLFNNLGENITNF